MTQRDDRQARMYVEASLAVFREASDLWCMNWCLFNLGYLDLITGNTTRARSRLRQSLEMAGLLGARQQIGNISLGLARLSGLEGDTVQAQAYLRDGLRIFRDAGTPAVYDALCFMGELAAIQGDYHRSVCLLAAGTRRRSRYVPIVCSIYASVCQTEWEACLVTARSELGEDGLTAAWAEGITMNVEQAVTYALAESKVEAMAG